MFRILVSILIVLGSPVVLAETGDTGEPRDTGRSAGGDTGEASPEDTVVVPGLGAAELAGDDGGCGGGLGSEESTSGASLLVFGGLLALRRRRDQSVEALKIGETQSRSSFPVSSKIRSRR